MKGYGSLKRSNDVECILFLCDKKVLKFLNSGIVVQLQFRGSSLKNAILKYLKYFSIFNYFVISCPLDNLHQSRGDNQQRKTSQWQMRGLGEETTSQFFAPFISNVKPSLRYVTLKFEGMKI